MGWASAKGISEKKCGLLRDYDERRNGFEAGAYAGA